MSLHAVEVTEDFKLLTPTWLIDLLGGLESEIMKSLFLRNCWGKALLFGLSTAHVTWYLLPVMLKLQHEFISNSFAIAYIEHMSVLVWNAFVNVWNSLYLFLINLSLKLSFTLVAIHMNVIGKLGSSCLMNKRFICYSFSHNFLF